MRGVGRWSSKSTRSPVSSWRQTRDLRGERQQLREELARLHDLLRDVRRGADAGPASPAAAGLMTEAAHKLSVQAAVTAMRDAERVVTSERVAQAVAEERAAYQQHRCVNQALRLMSPCSTLAHLPWVCLHPVLDNQISGLTGTVMLPSWQGFRRNERGSKMRQPRCKLS